MRKFITHLSKTLLLLISISLLRPSGAHAQTDTVRVYPEVASFGYSYFGAFELTTIREISINGFEVIFPTSTGPHSVVVGYRPGGVPASYANLSWGQVAFTAADGWITRPAIPINTVPLNVLTPIQSFPTPLVLESGTYGIYLDDEGGGSSSYTAFDQWTSGKKDIFSDSTVTVQNGPGKGFTGRRSTNQININTQLVCNVLYTPVPLVPNDLRSESIDMNTICAGSNMVQASIVNNGSNVVSSGTVNWSVNGVLQTPVSLGVSLDTIGSSGSYKTQVNLGNYTFADNVNYEIKVWTSMPNGATDPKNGNDTIVTHLQTSMAGTFTVDVNGSGANNFTSLNALGKALSERGVCGPVNVTFAPGIYTDHMVLRELAGASSTNTITFDGGDTSLVYITYSSAVDTPTVFLNGADWVTFKNLTISNTSTDDGWGLMLSNQADHITVDSCRFILPISSNTDMIGIIASKSLDGEDSGNNANFTTIRNSTFIGGESAITLQGHYNRPYVEGCILHNNTFRYQDDHGIEVWHISGVQITHNDVDSLVGSVGIGLMTRYLDNYDIQYNKIVSQRQGVVIINGNQDYVGPSRSTVVNNMIISQNHYGLTLSSSENTDVYYNSSKGRAGLYVVNHVGLDIRNNIFYGTHSSIPSARFNGELLPNDIVDYNVYYSEASPDVVEYLGTDYTTLQGFQLASKGNNMHSIQGSPFFKGAFDLHATGWFPEARADASVGIMDDIDGESRGPNPDIGADQYVPDTVACLPITGFILSNVGSNSVDLTFDDVPGDSLEVVWGPCGFTQGTAVPSIVHGTSPFTISGLTPESCYEFYARRSCDTSSNSFTPWKGPYEFQTGCGSAMSGAYTVNSFVPTGGSNFATLQEALDRLEYCGVSGPVTIHLPAATLNDNFVIREVDGVSATNTITIQGVDSALTVISYNGTDVRGAIEINGTDWITIKNLKIDRTYVGPYQTDGITISGESSHITIEGCAIKMGVLTPPSQSGTTGIYCYSNSNVEDINVFGNTIYNGRFAISLSVPNGLPKRKGIVVKNNVLVNNISGGVSIGDYSDVTISENHIYGVGNNPGNFPGGRFHWKSGVSCNRVDNLNIGKNIMNIESYGVRIEECGLGSTQNGKNLVVNNVIRSSGGLPTMYIKESDATEIYHNTISTVDSIACLSENNLDVSFKNNIFVSDSDQVVYYLATGPDNVHFDHNTYYSTVNNPFYINGTTYNTLSQWQTANTNENEQAFFADPMFASSTDLHASAREVNNSGAALGITADFDGNLRSSLFPDMGAYEFSLPCLLSTNGAASSITPNSAELSWTAGTAHLFNIEYGTAGFTLGSGTEIKAVDTPYLLTGLSHSTAYEFYVQDSCGTEGVSGWAGPFSFTTATPAPCGVSSALGATQLTTSTATLYWMSNTATNWNVEYGPTGYTQGNGTLVFDTQNDTLTLSGLAANTCYDFYVQDSCGLNYTSAWVGPFNFCTAMCTLNAGKDTTVEACVSVVQLFDLTPYLGTHDTGGTWLNLDGNASLFGNQVLFGPGSTAGTFRAAYYVTQPSCPNDTAIITINANEAPNAGTDMSFNICDTLSLDLDTVLTGQDAGGTWLDVDNSGGLSGSVVDFSLVAHSSTYLYQYVVLGVGCSNDTANILVTVDSCKTIGMGEYAIRGLQVYPNPNSGTVNVTFTTSSNQAELRLTDLSGQLVYAKTLDNLSGKYTGSIDMSRFAAGTYLLTIESEGAQKVVRVLRSVSE